jgi:N-acetylmuramoyl-L-alanine amidase
MNKSLALCIPIALILCAFNSFGALHESGVTVALDIGHSPSRPGAISARGMPEFSFNNLLANTISDTFRAHQVKVRIIDENGEPGDLRKRARLASGTNLLLSIHHDSVQPQYLKNLLIDGKLQRASDRFSGYSLFVSRLNPNIAISMKCASAIGTALRNAGFKPSSHHAQKIPGENRSFADETNGVYYFDNLVILKTATVPALLLEAGIIVNPDDELVLRESSTRQMIASAVADAMVCLSTSQP